MTEQVKNQVDLGEHFFQVGKASVAKVTGFIEEERLVIDVDVRANCIPVNVIEERDEETDEAYQSMRTQAANTMIELLKRIIKEHGGEVGEDDFTYVGEELKPVTE